MNNNKDKITVLLIEDNPGDTLLLKEMLADSLRTSFRVICASRLTEGLKNLEHNTPDIILVDLGLPDSQGIKTFEKISDGAEDVPIVVMTGLDDEEIATEAMRKGAQDYIVKGAIDSNLLVRAMRYAIERKRLEQEREKLISELKAALAKIKTLSGLIPICSFCKKIREDDGFWKQIEEYVRDHADINFSHSICPDCAQKHYPDLYDEDANS